MCHVAVHIRSCAWLWASLRFVWRTSPGGGGGGGVDTVARLSCRGCVSTSGFGSHHVRVLSLQTAFTTAVTALTSADWFSVVAFAGSINPRQFKTHLVQATADNIEDASEWIADMTTAAGTDYNTAFDAAFDILDASSGSGSDSTCVTAIVFLTDGASSGGLLSSVVVVLQCSPPAHVCCVVTTCVDSHRSFSCVLGCNSKRRPQCVYLHVRVGK